MGKIKETLNFKKYYVWRVNWDDRSDYELVYTTQDQGIALRWGQMIAKDTPKGGRYFISISTNSK